MITALWIVTGLLFVLLLQTEQGRHLFGLLFGLVLMLLFAAVTGRALYLFVDWLDQPR